MDGAEHGCAREPTSHSGAPARGPRVGVHQLNAVSSDEPHEPRDVPQPPWDASPVKGQWKKGALHAAGEGVRNIPDLMAPGGEFVSEGGGVDLCSSDFQLREGHEYVHSARQYIVGAGGGTRTRTPSLAPDFESGASTNSTTPASWGKRPSHVVYRPCASRICAWRARIGWSSKPLAFRVSLIDLAWLGPTAQERAAF